MNYKKIIVFLISYCFFSQSHAAIEPRPSLDGNYILQLKTGNKNFEDQLNIKGVDQLRVSAKTKLSGTYTVPNQFISKLEGTAHCAHKFNSCDLYFSIVADENNQKYKVQFIARLNGQDYINAFKQHLNGIPDYVMTGTAHLENGETLGTFKIIRAK